MGKGTLVFKDEKPKQKKKRSKHEVSNEGVALAKKQGPPSEYLDELSGKASSLKPVMSIQPKVIDGTGTITTSGTVISGHNTQFLRELSVGDALLVRDEMRVVTMCLSNTSINVSSAFSTNIKEPLSFQYIRKPRNVAQEAHAQRRQHLLEESEEKSRAAGVYAEEKTLVYREKTSSGSYRIRKEELRGDVTRTELVEMRSKKKHDKYC